MPNCCCNKRIISNVIDSGLAGQECGDICTIPVYGDPDFLTVLTPVVYDEIGINLCRSIPLPGNIPTDFPTAVYATAEVMDIIYTVNPTEGDGVTITPLSLRPNCFEVVLSNLTVFFIVKLFDCCKRLLTTFVLPEIIFLPPNATDPGFNEDTNPNSVALELFAPYGVAYTDTTSLTPILNFIGFTSTNNTINQGLNLITIPKVLDFDPTTTSITIGLTLVVKSIYFTQYMLPHNGKAIVSKGVTSGTDNAVCLTFVEGNLLDRNIKPLELCENNMSKN